MKNIKGIVSKWDEIKGFGFISSNDSNRDLFFHINDYSTKHLKPYLGLPVRFYYSKDKNNRPCAIQVTPTKGHRKLSKSTQQLRLSLVTSFTFFGFISILLYLKKIPTALLIIYLVMSIILFLLYAKDKSAAQKGKWRTTEAKLHLFSLLGGWPGALIAQNKLRHKSKKTSFRVYYWMTVFINCYVLGWFLTKKGSITLILLNDKLIELIQYISMLMK